MGDKAVVVEAVPIHRHVQFLLHDGRGLLDNGTVVDIRCRIRLRLVIDEMQGDGGGFFPRERDFQALFQDVQRLPAQLGFSGVELPHLVEQRQLDVDVLAVALDGKVNVVRQGEHHVLPELIVHFLIGQIHDLGRCFQHIFRDAFEHRQLFFVHIVKGAVDFGKRHIVGRLCESDALAEGHHLIIAAVQTQGDIVVDVLDDLHLPESSISATIKKPKVHPYLQRIRESLRRVTNLT